MEKRKDILERKDEILCWISQNQSNTFIASQLKCKIDTLKRYYRLLGITYNGNMGGKGIKHDPKRKSAIEYINGSCVKSQVLKQKLFEDGLKEEKCEKCGQGVIWQGERLPLELHHINGNHFDNRLENLMILCPNCHAIQPGNSGKNVGAYTK